MKIHTVKGAADVFSCARIEGVIPIGDIVHDDATFFLSMNRKIQNEAARPNFRGRGPVSRRVNNSKAADDDPT